MRLRFNRDLLKILIAYGMRPASSVSKQILTYGVRGRGVVSLGRGVGEEDVSRTHFLRRDGLGGCVFLKSPRLLCIEAYLHLKGQEWGVGCQSWAGEGERQSNSFCPPG